MAELMQFLERLVGNSFALWILGLLLSYRLIIPAREFLSERSARWVADQISHRRGGRPFRRFGVSFKRYVDRAFRARQVRIGRCRFWLFRFGRSALISFVTFQVLYLLVLRLLDYDALLAGVTADIRNVADPTGPAYDPSMAGIAGLVEQVDPVYLLVAVLAFQALSFGLLNTIVDFASFIETRNILARLGRGGVLRDLLLVALDVVLTTLIAAFGFVLLWMLANFIGSIFTGRSLPVSGLASDGLALARFALANAWSIAFGTPGRLQSTDPALFAMSASTYATSIWIWIYFSGALLLRLVAAAQPLLRLVSFLVDVDQHPFRAVWLMFAVLWTVAIAAWVLV